jgi:hypothetical protein
MLTISLGAMSYLGNLLREIEAPGDVAIRLVLFQREKRFAMRLDHQHASDTQWKQGDRTVLVLSPRIHMFVANQQLQLDTDELGEQLEFVSQRSLKCA